MSVDRFASLESRLSVELIIADYCPNVDASRALIEDTLMHLGLPIHWEEWWVGDVHMPMHCQGYGSPTILVNGIDVAGWGQTQFTEACAVYSTVYTVRGMPTSEELISAMSQCLAAVK